MRWIDKLRLRRRSLFERNRVDDELDSELRFHLDEQIEENIRGGMTPQEARVAALRAIGGISQFKEECRDMRRVNWIENFVQDVRYGLRQLRKTPGFTAVAVLSLSLGIGANTAIFSIVNAYLFRNMPVEQPNRLVAIYLTAPQISGGLGLSYPDLLDYRKQDTGLSDIMGSTGVALSVTDRDKPELIWGEIVTGNYFSGLGVRPILGRGFVPDEDKAPGQAAVCVINYHFWRDRFHGDPGVIGRTIKINRHPFTIIGVAPHGFIGTTLFNFIPDVWIPVMMQRTVAPNEGDYLDGRGNRWMSPRARLKPGVSLQHAEAALNVVARRLAGEYPQTNGDLRVRLLPAGARMQPDFAALGLISKTVGLLAGVVILVLLIACANVGNLMLARAQARAREMAIRIAVGAGRTRLLRQMLTESLLLAVLAAGVGIVLAILFGRMLASFYPSLDFHTADLDYEMRLDSQTFLFAIAAAALTAVLFGLLPALRASDVEQVSAMKGATTSERSTKWRLGHGNILIVGQVAISSVLLIWGGLFLRSTQYSHQVDLGFDRSDILMFGIDLDLQGYAPEQGRVFQRTLMERLRTIPGVENVSLAAPLPLDAYERSILVLPEGYIPRSNRESNAAGLSIVGPDYFAVMGTRLVAGRGFDGRDGVGAPKVAVINETTARRYWQTPHRAIGQRFRSRRAGPLIEVVGVARDGKYGLIGEPPMAYCFLPLEQDYQGRTTVLLRSKASRDALVPAIRRVVSSLDATLPVFGIRTVPEFLNRILSVYDMGAALLVTFAVAALLLAAIGIFGVLHFIVVRRTREIGIRMALGATPSRVLALIVARSMIFVAGGIAIGAAVALAASGVTGSLVAGVSGSDPIAFGSAIVLFIPVAFLAVLVPARRAMHVEPLSAIRLE